MNRVVNSKLAWTIIAAILILTGLFLAYLSFAASKNMNPITTTNIPSSTSDQTESKTEKTTISELKEAIAANPTDTTNYSKKSELEYNLGNKEAAIETVKEGLKNNPNDELLKSRLDTLTKDGYSTVEGDGRL